MNIIYTGRCMRITDETNYLVADSAAYTNSVNEVLNYELIPCFSSDDASIVTVIKSLVFGLIWLFFAN